MISQEQLISDKLGTAYVDISANYVWIKTSQPSNWIAFYVHNGQLENTGWDAFNRSSYQPEYFDVWSFTPAQLTNIKAGFGRFRQKFPGIDPFFAVESPPRIKTILRMRFV